MNTSLLALFAEMVGISKAEMQARIEAWVQAHPDAAVPAAELVALLDREAPLEKILATLNLGLQELKTALDTGRSEPGDDLSALS